MSDYTPDYWQVIKIDGPEPVYKVLAGWGGGYLHGQSWKLNSGITEIVEHDTYYDVHGYSGSVYKCRKTCEGTSYYTESILEGFVERSGPEHPITKIAMEEALKIFKE